GVAPATTATCPVSGGIRTQRIQRTQRFCIDAFRSGRDRSQGAAAKRHKERRNRGQTERRDSTASAGAAGPSAERRAVDSPDRLRCSVSLYDPVFSVTS